MTTRNAVVTGGASGIGRYVAGELLKIGVNTLVIDTDEIGLKRFKSSAESYAGRCDIAVVDVSGFSSVERAMERSSLRDGSWLAAICCAGILRFGQFTNLTEHDWEATLKVNVLGTVSICRSIIPAMRSVGNGRIVCISSWFGKIGKPNFSAYCASKFAIIGLVQSLAQELANDNILVNAVCPGTISD